jgi:hypothetical protein
VVVWRQPLEVDAVGLQMLSTAALKLTRSKWLLPPRILLMPLPGGTSLAGDNPVIAPGKALEVMAPIR